MRTREVAIVSVGLHPWGVFPDSSQPEMAVKAILKALNDADMSWPEVEFIAAGSPMWVSKNEGTADLLSGIAIESLMGSIGVPVININGGCATGIAALYIACMAVASGEYDIALAVAADKSSGQSFLPQSGDNKNDIDYIRYVMTGSTPPVYWAAECRRRMKDVGTTDEDLAKVKVMLSQAGAKNPRARYRRKFTLEEVLNSPVVCDPLHLFEISALSDGAGAVIVSSLEKAAKYISKPVLIEGISTGTASFGNNNITIPQISSFQREGVSSFTESRNALKNACEQATKRYNRKLPEDIDVIELPDSTSWHYLTYLEMALGLSPGEADKMLRNGDTHPLTGMLPVCPSGGVSCSGDSIAAQGIFQISSAVDQLRGEAGACQVTKDVKLVLTQSDGYGGMGAAALLGRAW